MGSSHSLIALFNMLQNVDSKQKVVLKETVQRKLVEGLLEAGKVTAK